eukprot:12294594-Heterocapsa_arctica.AAC.1
MATGWTRQLSGCSVLLFCTREAMLKHLGGGAFFLLSGRPHMADIAAWAAILPSVQRGGTPDKTPLA